MSGERILVIDDSKEIARHLTQQLLPTLGYETLQAFDGRSGLQMIREEKPDLVMLDLNLPEMTGIDILQVMSRESLDIPVVLMTGYGSEKNAIDAFRLGIKDYLVKPFTVDEVVTALNRAMGQVDDGEQAEPAPAGAAPASSQQNLANEGLRRQLNQMQTLFGIGKVVTSLLSVEQILERVLDAAVYLTNAEESIIWLPELSSGTLRAYARKGGNDGSEKQLLSLSMRDSQVGQVMRSGRPLRLYTGTGQGFKVKTGYLARAIMYVPLMVRGKALGVLSVTNRLSPRAFSERDEFLLVALADYAAIALQNARTFQQTDQALAAGTDELKTLVQITRMITSSLNLDEIVRLTIQQVHDSWKIGASSLWLVDRESQTLRIQDNVGIPKEVMRQFRIPLGQGIVGYVAQTGKPILSNDVPSHPLHYRRIDEKTGFRSQQILCVPLIFREDIIGALQLLNPESGEFVARDIERAEALASAVAIAVNNALQFREAGDRQRQLEAVLEHNGNPVILVNNRGELQLLNHQARVRLGLSNEAIGRPAQRTVEPPELAEFLSLPLTNAESNSSEIKFPDGTTWLCTLAPIPNVGRMLFLQDISYLKRRGTGPLGISVRQTLDQILTLGQRLRQADNLSDEQKETVAQILALSDQLLHVANQEANN
ncbi:MAG: GAF domain-containing protein [Anaerolineales bacterium]|nr:GAF domain-containing protein [Anaerolineales bacterium]